LGINRRDRKSGDDERQHQQIGHRFLKPALLAAPATGCNILGSGDQVPVP
jgi:hypothetical protein